VRLAFCGYAPAGELKRCPAVKRPWLVGLYTEAYSIGDVPEAIPSETVIATGYTLAEAYPEGREQLTDPEPLASVTLHACEPVKSPQSIVAVWVSAVSASVKFAEAVTEVFICTGFGETVTTPTNGG